MTVFSVTLNAEEKISIKGKVKSISIENKTAIITTDEGKDIEITVEDEETLTKFKDGRIGVDDDVKVKYIKKGDKNISTYFKKVAGC
jgi:hypothetical protein